MDYLEARYEADERNAALALKALADRGVASIYLKYDGVRDEGLFVDGFFYDANDDNVTHLEDVDIARWTITFSRKDAASGNFSRCYEVVEGVADTLGSAADDLGRMLLQKHHKGWETGAGSFGVIRIDVASLKAVIQHNARGFFDTSQEETAFDLQVAPVETKEPEVGP